MTSGSSSSFTLPTTTRSALKNWLSGLLCTGAGYAVLQWDRPAAGIGVKRWERDRQAQQGGVTSSVFRAMSAPRG